MAGSTKREKFEMMLRQSFWLGIAFDAFARID